MSNTGNGIDKKTHLGHIFKRRKMRLWQKSHTRGLHLDTDGLGL